MSGLAWWDRLRRIFGGREDAARTSPRADGRPRVECGMCGRRFTEDRGQPACRACPLARACRFVRCPGCGYENPVSPGWMRRREVSA